MSDTTTAVPTTTAATTAASDVGKNNSECKSVDSWMIFTSIMMFLVHIITIMYWTETFYFEAVDGGYSQNLKMTGDISTFLVILYWVYVLYKCKERK